MTDTTSIKHPSQLTSGDFTAADEPFALFGEWFAEAAKGGPNTQSIAGWWSILWLFIGATAVFSGSSVRVVGEAELGVQHSGHAQVGGVASQAGHLVLAVLTDERLLSNGHAGSLFGRRGRGRKCVEAALQKIPADAKIIP